MRNVMKAATLESKFPLLAVENGCIVSKEADVTVAFRVELPELFSVTGSEYEAVHSAWHKAGEGAAGVFHRTTSRTSSSRRSTGRKRTGTTLAS